MDSLNPPTPQHITTDWSYNAATWRSLRNEASRQADFFMRKDPDVAAFWNALETVAHLALAKKTGLRLILVPNTSKDTINNPCE